MKYRSRLTGLVALTTLATTMAHAQRYSNLDSVKVWSGRIADGGMLTVKNIVGDITVVESPDDRVEVRAEKRTRGRSDPADVAFDVREAPSNTTICTVYRGESACDGSGFSNVRLTVKYTIAMPRGVRLRASTGNGELSVEKAGAEVQLSTGNGAIHIGETSGTVTASTGNGDLEIESARGPVRASSGNGRIFVSTASGPVSATTGNGDIDVRMKALSTDADMDFRSGSGAVRVTLPPDFNGDVDASTGSGDLRTDFAIKLVGRLDPQHMRGTIGTGGRIIHLSTGSGRLEIRKGS
jgi:Putative adhesin